MSNECRFVLQPLHCSLCGAYVNELGTCEDQKNVFCKRCFKKMFGEEVIKAEGDMIWLPDDDEDINTTYHATSITK